jgi:anti-sigma factor RsiW
VADMDHEAAEATFSAYADGELRGEEKAALEAHLAGCEACRKELASFQETLRAVHEAQPVAPPDEFVDALKARIHERSRGRFFGKKRTYGLEIASLVMLAVAVAVYVVLRLADPSWLLR